MPLSVFISDMFCCSNDYVAVFIRGIDLLIPEKSQSSSHPSFKKQGKNLASSLVMDAWSDKRHQLIRLHLEPQIYLVSKFERLKWFIDTLNQIREKLLIPFKCFFLVNVI